MDYAISFVSLRIFAVGFGVVAADEFAYIALFVVADFFAGDDISTA